MLARLVVVDLLVRFVSWLVLRPVKSVVHHVTSTQTGAHGVSRGVTEPSPLSPSSQKGSDLRIVSVDLRPPPLFKFSRYSPLNLISSLFIGYNVGIA